LKKIMSMRLFLTTILLFLTFDISLHAQSNGENLFKSTCTACHTIGKGRLVGPDLSGVYERTDQEWLIRFIRSSQEMVKEGDSLAVALFKEFNQIPMPNNDLTDEQILSIIDYIRKTDAAQNGENVTQTEKSVPSDSTTTIQVTDELANKGNALFYGYEDFTNGASSCIACHRIQNGSLIGGGKLSFDLTSSYSRLGQAGIKAILSNAPFPAMNTALRGKNLTNDEIQALTAMLQFVDQRFGNNPTKSNNGFIFIVLSLISATFVLVGIYLLYDDRKIPS